MPFGMSGEVGHSNHVLDGDPDPPIVRNNFGGFPYIEKRRDCVIPSVRRPTHDTCHPLAKDAGAIRRLRRRICDQEVAGSIPGRGDAVQRLWAS